MEKIKGINIQSIQTIEIKKGSQTIKFNKENNIWKIKNEKADADKIQSLLSTLMAATIPELVAQTDKRYKEFELTNDLATVIKLDNKLTVYTGKYNGAGIYARLDGSPMVYVLKNTSAIPTTSSEWYDLTIIALDQSKVTKLSFEDNDTPMIIIKKGDKWISEKTNKEAKKDKVDSILSILSKLTAQSLLEESKKDSYPASPDLTLVIEYEGKSNTLEFFKGESDYLVKREADSGQFIVSEYAVSSLISAPQEIF
ncbi:DUF4340 domain-containing protein [Patescibacteria group bacterium]|nr:DUF4340 domain-containing protein [Patescibacteria group bacterium]MBU4098304.1 DUF4340 domain-containing protein [Patescibacteria group bacterium]